MVDCAKRSVDGGTLTVANDHTPFRSPLSTLFRQRDDGKMVLKPASSSPPDIDVRDTVASEYEFDPNQEAKPRDATTVEMLREIRDLLRDMRPNPPADNFRPMSVPVTDTTGGEKTLDVIGGWEYVYIPPVPRTVTVYWRSMTWPLAVLQTGQAAKLHIPYRLDEFSLSWGAGAATDVIYLLFTTDPIDVDILAY